MAVFKVKAKNRVDIDKKPRVYFTCHPDDFEKYFKKVCDDIFKTHDCAIYYTEDMSEVIADDEKQVDLGRNNLFVIPVTFKLLTTPNRAMDEDIPYALKEHIPVLPIMMELVDDELYSSKFGELQYLNPLSEDQTEIPYEEKLKKHLKSVLISKELADRIRHAFYAYIFLSYRKVDRAYANTLMRLIHSIPDCRDFAIWFDEFLTPGESFKANIEKALDDCKLFTLLVTERLFKKNVDEHGNETDNFVIANELPMAKDKRAEKGTEIFAVEMEDVDEDAPSRLGADEYIRYDDAEFRDRLIAAISKIKYDVVDTSEHTFLMGLAYLEGIDMEVNRERAVKLIESAAEADLAEAMEKLIRMYKDGVGVARDVKAVQDWSKRLADHYFRRIFSKKGKLKSKKKLLELFLHYTDDYFAETIKEFLICADKRLTEKVIIELYEFLMQQEICEYTLFFEACKNMSQYQEKTQIILVTDILTKSVEGTYPPYGPLFWYVPEYELYEVSLLTLDALKNHSNFAKMLALVRDVCWIFGQNNTCDEITARVLGTELYSIAQAELTDIRKALCELFFTSDTDSSCANSIYPRCFNLAEAKSFKNNGNGILGVMSEPFYDSLGLYSDNSFNMINEEYIGLISCPYTSECVEMLSISNVKKIRGIVFSSSNETAIRACLSSCKKLEIIYIPENIILFEQGWCQSLPLIQTIAKTSTEKLYVRKEVVVTSNTFSIEKNMYSDCVSIESVAIEDGVEVIGDGAFANCINLKTLSLSNSIEEIGARAFSNCKTLSVVYLPKSLVRISHSLFYGCKNLERVIIPNGVKGIDGAAFRGCEKLRDIIIPSSVKQVEYEAFYGCKSITKINIPDHITGLEFNTFTGCENLCDINLPKGLTEIGYGLFEGCTSIKEIIIPDSVEIIGERAFCECINLKHIKTPISLVTIGNYAFYNCQKLIEVLFGPNLQTIGWYAFMYCVSLSSIHFPKIMKLIEGGAFSKCCKLKEVTIPNTTRISYDTFEKQTRINLFSHQATDTTVLCESANAIRENEYLNRLDLATFTVPYGVKEIKPFAFKGCKNLVSIYIPQTVEKIGFEAFEGCSCLTEVNLPSNITFIGDFAFKCCVALKKVKLSKKITYISKGMFYGCVGLESIKIPNNIKTIEGWAFDSCEKLNAVHLPKNIMVESNAFANCINLKNIELSDGIEGMYCMFYNCTNLQHITLPETVNELSTGMFKNCQNLSFCNIPDNVQRIGYATFEGCKSLTSIRIPNTITKIESKAFCGCLALSSINIPEGLSKIWSRTFAECKSLTSVNIPEGIVEIEEEAFKDCSSIKSLIIPENVHYIGNNAFLGCQSLRSVSISRRFEDDINRIFGDVDMGIFTLI